MELLRTELDGIVVLVNGRLRLYTEQGKLGTENNGAVRLARDSQ